MTPESLLYVRLLYCHICDDGPITRYTYVYVTIICTCYHHNIMYMYMCAKLILLSIYIIGTYYCMSCGSLIIVVNGVSSFHLFSQPHPFPS